MTGALYCSSLLRWSSCASASDWFTAADSRTAAASESSRPKQTLTLPRCALYRTSSALQLSAEDGLGPGLVTVDLTDASERCLSASILSKVVNLLSSALSPMHRSAVQTCTLPTVTLTERKHRSSTNAGRLLCLVKRYNAGRPHCGIEMLYMGRKRH